jgi:acetyltransferase-like isoleucine patch superfamily enzyme
MNPFARMWWTLNAEVKGFALWLLAGMPTGVGVWVRARLLRFFFKHLGERTVIQAGMRVTNPEKVSIGSRCNFAQGVFITGGGGVTIGDWVGFGPDAKVWSVNHRFDDPDRPWLQQGWEQQPVVIEDDVWLGAGVFVMPGVTIGKGAIISACALVNKSIPPYALVAGNPARVVGWRKRPPDADAPPAPAHAAAEAQRR